MYSVKLFSSWQQLSSLSFLTGAEQLMCAEHLHCLLLYTKDKK